MRTVQLGQKVKGSHAEHVRLLPSLPERVEIVRRIFTWYAGPSSLGFKAIADRLNREGVVSPKQRGWSLSSIRAMIVNTVYIGHVVWNRRAMGKFHRIADRREVERDGCGKRRLDWNAPEDWLVYENAHEPLIDRELFDRAQRVMKERGARRGATGFLIGKAKASPYLLSGLLRCGACGGSMHGRAVWKSKRRKDGSRVGTFYYVCSAAIAEKREIEDRLRAIDPAPVRITDPEAVVDTILEGLTDASRLFENGTMEERKRVVRAFVETLTLDGQTQTGVLRIKKLPMPQNGTGNSSFKNLAAVLYEVQKRSLARETEVVRVASEWQGRALVPVVVGLG